MKKKALHVFIYLMLTAFKFPYILSPRSYTRDMYGKRCYGNK